MGYSREGNGEDAVPGPGGIVRQSTREGQATTIGDVTVIPRSRTLEVRLPLGGFVWSRPVGVRIRRGDDVEELPIHDVTRRLQLGFAAALGILLLVRWIGRPRKRPEDP